MDNRNEVDPITELEGIIKRNPRKSFAAGLGVVGLLIGGITCVVQSENRERDELKQALEASGALEGKIAYVDDRQIHVVEAHNIVNPSAPIKKIQAYGNPQQLLWLNEQELAFVRKADRPESLGKVGSDFSILSDSLYRVNVNSGEASCLVNPYSEKVLDIFGDVLERDRQKVNELNRWIKENREKGRGHLIAGDHSNFNIEGIGYSAREEKIYFCAGSDWYGLDMNRDVLSRETLLPEDLRRPSLKSPDGSLVLRDEFLLPLQIYRNDKNVGLPICEENAEEPADWFSASK